ncbi:hypothetical protein R0381_003621 [Jeongeupia wiesaeckerbachi]|uniref:helix-turn-helix domain-containing protein n=1 Tax=Jeongeupia wiesaeckerbachi TaxID=3051218 RepID=UPI003D8018DE
MSETSKPAQSVRRAFRLVWVLQGHSFEGLRLKQVADALQVSSPMALRDLQVLAEEGLAERVPGREDCWRLTPKLVQLACAHQEEMRRLKAAVDEFTQRYTRQPR